MSASNGALASPAPLGLLGFGMTPVLLNVHNAGFVLHELYGRVVMPLGVSKAARLSHVSGRAVL